MGHLAITVHDKLNPKGTIAITQKIKLDRIDFPAVLKICILPSFNKTELKKVGYNSPFDEVGTTHKGLDGPGIPRKDNPSAMPQMYKSESSLTTIPS